MSGDMITVPREKWVSLVDFYDRHVGTPCAEIRWQHEREELLKALEGLKHRAWNVYQGVGPDNGDADFEKAFAFAISVIAKSRGDS